MISYAQNFEDVMLARALGDRATGFYVDVGACFPDTASVTRHFYDLGWQGINVEPMDEPFAALAAARERDINVRAAVAAHDGEIAIYAGPTIGESSAVRPFDTAQPTVVPCMTLATLCRTHAARPIDFLKIDVEGLEREVIEGGDWDAFRPTIVVIEVTRPWSTQRRDDAPQIAAFMQSRKYDEVYFDGLNAFYLAREAAVLASRFAAPPNALDRFTLAREVEQLRQLDEVRSHADAVEKRLAEVREHSEAVSGRLADVQAHANIEHDRLLEVQAAGERLHLELRARESDAEALRSELNAVQLRAGQLRRHLELRLARTIQDSQRRIASLTAASNARIARILRRSRNRLAKLVETTDIAVRRAAAAEEREEALETAVKQLQHAEAQARAEFQHAASVAGQAHARVADLEARQHDAMQRALQAEHTLSSMKHSRSWRITAPLRALGDWFRGGPREASQATPSSSRASGRLRAAALRRGRLLAKRTPLYHWLAPRLKARYPDLWARARSAVIEHPAAAPVTTAALASPDASSGSIAPEAGVPSAAELASRIRDEIARRRSA